MNSELNEINEIRKLAGLSPLEEGRKVVKPVIAYHGTSSIFLPSIMKYGLLPNPGDKVWNTGYLESYGGVYLTNSKDRADNAADDAVDAVDGRRMLITVQLTLPSAKMDEDSVTVVIERAIGAIIQKEQTIDTLNSLDKDEKEALLDKLVSNFLNGMSRMKLKRGTKRYVREVFKLILSRPTHENTLFVGKHLRIFNLFPWYNNNPDVQDKFRKLIERITNSSLNYQNYQEREVSFRLERPIGFRGRNRILSIEVETEDGDRIDWEQVYP